MLQRSDLASVVEEGPAYLISNREIVMTFRDRMKTK